MSSKSDRADDDAVNRHSINLLEIFLERPEGKNCVQFLTFPDLLRLAVCSKSLNSVHSRHRDASDWLRDLEILNCLPCDDDDDDNLRRKMSKSMRLYPDRVRCLYDFSEDEERGPSLVAKTLHDAYEHGFLTIWNGLAVFRSRVGSRIVSCCEGDEFVDIPATDRWANPNGSSSYKRQRTTRACSGCSVSVGRLFCINSTLYCGACVASSTLLKLKFCSEHLEAGGDRPDYTLESIQDRTADEKRRWGLKEDEFWVRLLIYEPYANTSEIRFLGVTPKPVFFSVGGG